MNTDTFRNLDELNLRNVCQRLSTFGSFVYIWKIPNSHDLITYPDAFQLFGIEPYPPIFTNSDLEKLIHGEDLEKVKAREKELLEKGEALPIEFRINCPDGKQKYVRQSQELVRTETDIRILYILQDITEQKRADIILDIMNEAFFDLDNHFIFRKVNPEAELFLGKAKGELVGKNIWEVFPEIIGTPLYDTMKVVQKEKKAERKEILFPSNGKWIRASIAAYTDGLIVVFYDINEQKKADERLKDLNQSLERKNKELEQKNSELTLFSYITSNDLKAPLRKIYTSFEMILTREGAKLSNNAKAHFRRIQSSIQKINLLTDDLLSFARVNKNDEPLSQTDLNQVLDEAGKKLNQGTERKYIIESDKLPVIQGYADLLLQLFLHILSNAIKFQSKENEPAVQVRYEIITKNNRVVNNGDNPTAYKKISFEDNGIGFDNIHAEDIFGLFYKLHNPKEFKGTGVGLAICKKIMERHGGFIDATGSETGAVFACYFPDIP